jgi:hypothetical protein
MAKQLSLLDETAVEDADNVTFTADEALRRQKAEDTYRTDLLRRFWNERREAIMQSGNPVRIGLLNEHDMRERNRQ